ncbi:hypothetical protein WOLCODRAFT_22691 [Wolfiporia cocos MD-104 SS10]|uniref:Uncharacterized protein n=1 Tax=Wolfiporia cocos (strain MD-104) TaxID=742152 RepID=A0A2H3J6S5_WOLCO|nr:hypothetical protein WOLCODRAFT_22691 [Wolfiporia cocos MD-104 SS10]
MVQDNEVMDCSLLLLGGWIGDNIQSSVEARCERWWVPVTLQTRGGSSGAARGRGAVANDSHRSDARLDQSSSADN